MSRAGKLVKGRRRTSVDNILAVKVVNRAKHLLDGLGGILLCELALFADAIKQLATSCQLGDNVVFVLFANKPTGLTTLKEKQRRVLTLDSNQSTNLTMWGCFKR